MKKSEVVVNVKDVKDARPIAFLVQTASQFESKIYIDCEEKHVNAKSIMGMMTLMLENGTKAIVSAEGKDEDEAVTKIEEFLTAGEMGPLNSDGSLHILTRRRYEHRN